ncbi:MAG: hypothetical protein JWO12_3211 [Frankiales bacterium]|nr:hypothetical protein [Frankiales bacterium]
MKDESEARRQATERFEAGEYRAALHLWDGLAHPELLTDLEIAMREVALRERDR